MRGHRVRMAVLSSLVATSFAPSTLAGEQSKRFCVFERGKYGYINEAGTVVIPCHFEKASDFSEGLASVSVNLREGFIDQAGSFVIPAQFFTARDFSNGLAAVKTYAVSGEPSRRWGYIDQTGQQITPQQFESASDFSDGLALVQVDGKWGYIDRTGQFVIQSRFSKGRSFSQGLAAVEMQTTGGHSAWGFIDKTGRVMIQPSFSIAADFSEGVAWVAKKENKLKLMAINKQGKVIFVPPPAISVYFLEKASEGLWIFQEASDDRRRGYMDTRGNIVVAPQFRQAREFSERLAAVCPQGPSEVWGYIDTTGHMIIEPRFHKAESFHGGLARVVNQNGSGCYINAHGQVVWEPETRTES